MEIAKPAANTMGKALAIDTPAFGVLASSIDLVPNADTFDIEGISDLLPDGEAGNTIAALIVSDIELVLSE